MLQPNSPTAYAAALAQFPYWFEASATFLVPIESSATAANWPSPYPVEVYSTAQWQMVQMWGLNQEFGLEGMPQVAFGSRANVRGWIGNQAFFTSPNMLHIPASPGIGNGSQVVRDYLALAWYQTQLVLNDGQGTQNAHTPIDYGYVSGFVKDLFAVDSNVPGINLELTWEVKALQEFTQDGSGPQLALSDIGFSPIATSPEPLVYSAWEPLWSATSPATETTLLQAYTQAWFAQASRYTPQQYYQGTWATAAQNPATMNQDTTFGGQVWYMLPRLRFFGVDPTLINQMTAWAATIWPNGNWAFNQSATCTAETNCTSGY